MLVLHMTVVSFRLFHKNLNNLREFLGKWLTTTPPGKKLPVRLKYCVIAVSTPIVLSRHKCNYAILHLYDRASFVFARACLNACICKLGMRAQLSV